MKTILAILVAAALVLAIGLWLEGRSKPVVAARLPSLAEIQEMVGAKPDGVYGPETERLWAEALGNRYYKDSLERMEASDAGN